jgi:hypothetical protein
MYMYVCLCIYISSGRIPTTLAGRTCAVMQTMNIENYHYSLDSSRRRQHTSYLYSNYIFLFTFDLHYQNVKY